MQVDHLGVSVPQEVIRTGRKVLATLVDCVGVEGVGPSAASVLAAVAISLETDVFLEVFDELVELLELLVLLLELLVDVLGDLVLVVALDDGHFLDQGLALVLVHTLEVLLQVRVGQHLVLQIHLGVRRPVLEGGHWRQLLQGQVVKFICLLSLRELHALPERASPTLAERLFQGE